MLSEIGEAILGDEAYKCEEEGISNLCRAINKEAPAELFEGQTKCMAYELSYKDQTFQESGQALIEYLILHDAEVFYADTDAALYLMTTNRFFPNSNVEWEKVTMVGHIQGKPENIPLYVCNKTISNLMWKSSLFVKCKNGNNIYMHITDRNKDN